MANVTPDSTPKSTSLSNDHHSRAHILQRLQDKHMRKVCSAGSWEVSHSDIWDNAGNGGYKDAAALVWLGKSKGKTFELN
jgi:hypothetical protein